MTTILSLNQTGINAMIVNNSTARHAQVISQRIGSEELAMMKSLLIDQLKLKLKTGVAHFWFKKINGEIREAWGTTNHQLMASKILGTGLSGEEVNTIKFWSVTDGGFRSMRLENLIAVE